MKTFNELKKNRLSSEKIKLANDNRYNKQLAHFEQIKNSLEVIENIDEAVKIEIAIYANTLHDELRNESTAYTFYSIFKKYIYDAETKFANGNIYSNNLELSPGYNLMIIKSIQYLGFTIKDLQQLMDNNIDIFIKDVFINYINNFYNTYIPLSFEWKEYFDYPLPECKLEMTESNCRYSLLKLRNGDLVSKENYPLKYEADILKEFDIYPEIYSEKIKQKITSYKNNKIIKMDLY